MKIGALLAHIRELDTHLAAELQSAAERHADDQDVYHQCLTFAVTVDKRLVKLTPIAERHGGNAEWKSAIAGSSEDLLEDLRMLFLRTEESAITWVMASQAAQAARDEELKLLAAECHSEIDMQSKWFLTRIKTGAPQALVVGS
jgi:hypothetical protein